MNTNNSPRKLPFILIAEDDPDDQFLIKQTFQGSALSDSLIFVDDGEDLMDYLLGRKKYAENGPVLPMCLLLDLKMPRKDGREALREIRQNPAYADLPVLVLSTSDSKDDIKYCTKLGISDYMKKPDSYAGLLEMVEKARRVCFSSS